MLELIRLCLGLLLSVLKSYFSRPKPCSLRRRGSLARAGRRGSLARADSLPVSGALHGLTVPLRRPLQSVNCSARHCNASYYVPWAENCLLHIWQVSGP